MLIGKTRRRRLRKTRRKTMCPATAAVYRRTGGQRIHPQEPCFNELECTVSDDCDVGLMMRGQTYAVFRRTAARHRVQPLTTAMQDERTDLHCRSWHTWAKRFVHVCGGHLGDYANWTTAYQPGKSTFY
ncbi:Protein of unknown function [Gryllus bimaculatus]|nr:Protein of unknown function [Gryllus bimaculatus]